MIYSPIYILTNIIHRADKTRGFSYGNNELPEYAFCDMGKLKAVILPKTLTKVNMNAFIGCLTLDSIVLPSTNFVISLVVSLVVFVTFCLTFCLTSILIRFVILYGYYCKSVGCRYLNFFALHILQCRANLSWRFIKLS